MKSPVNSAIVIARLLSTEGFSDHTANTVERYWKTTAQLSSRQCKQIKRLEREIHEWAETMSAGQRMVLGRFIGLHKKMAFETGLRIGLGAFTVKNGRAIELPAGDERVNGADVRGANDSPAPNLADPATDYNATEIIEAKGGSLE